MNNNIKMIGYHLDSFLLQARGVCDFDPPLATSNGVTGLNRVAFSGFMDTITESLAITVEDTTSLLYVGTTNSSGNFLTMVLE